MSPADVKVNYNDAATACRDMNAHLAKISSLGEDVLVSAMRSGSEKVYSGLRWSPSEESGRLWIGMNDLDEEGNWVWEDGSTGTSYFNWIQWAEGDQEPNNVNGEDCGVKYWNGRDAANGGWADFLCQTRSNFVCSTPAKEDSCDPDKAMEEMLHTRTCIQQKTDNNSAQEKVQNLPPIDIFLNPKKEQHKEDEKHCKGLFQEQ